MAWSGANYERFSSDKYDRLYDQLNHELDPDERAEIAVHMNDLLVKDVVVIPLVQRHSPVSGKIKALQGVRANPWDDETWNIAEWMK